MLFHFKGFVLQETHSLNPLVHKNHVLIKCNLNIVLNVICFQGIMSARLKEKNYTKKK